VLNNIRYRQFQSYGRPGHRPNLDRPIVIRPEEGAHGRGGTAMTLDRAAERQHEAHTRSREALISAAWRYESSAEAHEQAAGAHEQAARIHDRAAKQEVDESAAHESAAAWHRAAWTTTTAQQSRHYSTQVSEDLVDPRDPRRH
jgi:hypothetical protein